MRKEKRLLCWLIRCWVREKGVVRYGGLWVVWDVGLVRRGEWEERWVWWKRE